MVNIGDFVETRSRMRLGVPQGTRGIVVNKTDGYYCMVYSPKSGEFFEAPIQNLSVLLKDKHMPKGKNG